MKIKEFYDKKPSSNNGASIINKQTIFDVYNEEREQRILIEQLNLGIDGKRESINRLDAIIGRKETELTDINNKADLAFEELETILKEVTTARQDSRTSKIEMEKGHESIFELERAINDKKSELEEISNNLKDAEELKNESIQLLSQITNQKRILENLDQSMFLKKVELDDYNKTHRSKVNALDSLDIEIQNKTAELEVLKAQTKKQSNKKTRT